MAEEFDIKSVWNKGKAKEDPSALQIDQLERKGTRTTLYWIKTILWIEFWLSLVALPPLVYFSLDNGNSFGFMAFYIGITIIYLFYYQFLIRQIGNFNYDRNVLQSLKKVYSYLRFYILHYKVVLWLSLIIGMIVGMIDVVEKGELPSDADPTRLWVSIIAFAIVALLIMGGLLQLFLHLIYGRKIKRLKRMVKDLESEE